MRGSLLLLLVLLVYSVPAMAQLCPVEKIPTDIELYVDRNEPSGVLEAGATLTGIDLANKASAPLPLEMVYFQECTIGNFSLTCPSYAHICVPGPPTAMGDIWNCSSGCCMSVQSKKTDSEGKASVLFPLMENTTIVAVYPGGDAYLSSNSTASYIYPPMLGALSITACFPLFFILGLLVLSMNAMGKSPIGAFDFSALHAPRARAKAVTPLVISTKMLAVAAGLMAAGKEVDSAIKDNKRKKEEAAKGNITPAQGPLAPGQKEPAYVVTDKGKAAGVVVVTGPDGRQKVTTMAELAKKADKMEKGKGILGKIGGVAWNVAMADWATKDRASNKDKKLNDMVRSGLIRNEGGKWVPTDEKNETVKRMLAKLETPAYAKNTSSGSGVWKTIFAPVGIVGGFAKTAVKATDFGLRTATGGVVGVTKGKVSLVKAPILGGKLIAKGAVAGAKQVAIGAKAVNAGLGGVPFAVGGAVGTGAYAVGKGAVVAGKTAYKVGDATVHVLQYATGKDSHGRPLEAKYFGFKAFGLDFGVGFGGTAESWAHTEHGWDPLGLAKERREAKANQVAFQEYMKHCPGMTVLELKRELEERKKNEETFTGYAQRSKDGEFELTAKGKKEFANFVKERSETTVDGTVTVKTLELTKKGEALVDGADKQGRILYNLVNTISGKGSGHGSESLSYETLERLIDMQGKETKVYGNERGPFGLYGGGWGFEQHGTIHQAPDGSLVLDAPAQKPTAGALLEALSYAKDSTYTMRFGRIEQIGAMGRAPSSEPIATVFEENENSQKAAELLENKDPANWSQKEMDMVSHSLGFQEVASHATTIMGRLEFRNAGLNLSEDKIAAVEKALGEQEHNFPLNKSFDPDKFEKDLQKAGLTGLEIGALNSYANGGTKQEGLRLIAHEMKLGAQTWNCTDEAQYGRMKDLVQDLHRENHTAENVDRIVTLTGGEYDLAQLRAERHELKASIEATQNKLHMFTQSISPIEGAGSEDEKGKFPLPTKDALRELNAKDLTELGAKLEENERDADRIRQEMKNATSAQHFEPSMREKAEGAMLESEKERKQADSAAEQQQSSLDRNANINNYMSQMMDDRLADMIERRRQMLEQFGYNV